MHLRSVEVESFGTINGPLEITFDDGLTLIYGPNETGKSTLMRAIWFAFTRRAQSQAQDIKDIEPTTGGTPEVTVELEVDGDYYTLTKRFAGQQGEATLSIERSSGQVEKYTGDEADAQLQQALGFGEMSGRARTPDHLGLWPITWVRQGQGGLDPAEALSEDGNEQTLSEVLAETTGQVLAGTDAAEVVERAREEYERFFTSSGRETTASGAPLHEARQTEEKARTRFRELESQQQNFERDIRAFGKAQEERDRLQQELPEQERKLQSAQEKQQQIDKLKQKREALQQEKKVSEQSLEQLQERIAIRKKLREQKKEAADELEESRKQKATAQASLKEREEEKDELEDELEEREKAVADQDEAVALLQAHQEVLRLESALKELERKLEKVEEHEEELREKRTELAGLSVTDEKLEALEARQKELDNARTRLEAAAARVQVKSQADEELTVDGDAVSLPAGEAWEQRIDRETVIAIGDRLSVTVVPGGEDLPALRRRVRDLEAQQASALKAIGASSLQEARKQNRRRTSLASDVRRLEELIDTLAPEGKDALESQRIEQEARRSSALELRRKAEERDDLNLPDAPEETEVMLERASSELAEEKEARDAARKALEEHEQKMADLRTEIGLAEQKLERAEGDLTSLKEEIDEHVEKHGDDKALQEARREASAQLTSVRDRLESLAEQLDELNAQHVEAEVQRLQDVLQQTREELKLKEREADRLEGRLGSKDLHGLHERVEKARQAWEDAKGEVARWERRAAVAKLLFETLDECKREARAAYLAPLQQEVKALMRRFAAFGDAHVEFGENFELSGISRSAEGEISFDQLSGGAKEQLGLFIRIAMARLVAKERSHPLFLDEILAETDDDRFEAMATILREISSDLQLIVTTCHKDRYRRLGLPITDLEALKRGSPTAKIRPGGSSPETRYAP